MLLFYIRSHFSKFEIFREPKNNKIKKKTKSVQKPKTKKTRNRAKIKNCYQAAKILLFSHSLLFLPDNHLIR